MVTTDRSKIIKPLAVNPISASLMAALEKLEEAKDSLCAGKLYHSKPASTEKIVLMEHLNRSKGVKDDPYN